MLICENSYRLFAVTLHGKSYNSKIRKKKSAYVYIS